MHGLTGGSWKRNKDRTRATEMKDTRGNLAVTSGSETYRRCALPRQLSTLVPRRNRHKRPILAAPHQVNNLTMPSALPHTRSHWRRLAPAVRCASRTLHSGFTKRGCGTGCPALFVLIRAWGSPTARVPANSPDGISPRSGLRTGQLCKRRDVVDSSYRRGDLVGELPAQLGQFGRRRVEQAAMTGEPQRRFEQFERYRFRTGQPPLQHPLLTDPQAFVEKPLLVEHFIDVPVGKPIGHDMVGVHERPQR